MIPPDRQLSFVDIGHEIFSTVILSLPLMGGCQFLANECAQVLVNRLEN